MAYRNGTYIAFHADGTNQPGKSDIDYYNLMVAWTEKKDEDFSMINSHDKAFAVRDTSLHATLRRSLLERLSNSRNMVLIIGETTNLDIDWVPFEIEKAVDTYKIPIIAAYTVMYKPIRNPVPLSIYWPKALELRINNGTANVIHIPFKKEALKDAISQLSHDNPPVGGGLTIYSDTSYKIFGIEG